MVADDAAGAAPSRKSGARLGDFLRTGYLIHDVSRLRRQFYDHQSRHLGITRAQWWALFNLARHNGEPLNQNELAAMLELGNASVGELVLKLEKSGFVRRVPDPQDRRAKRIVVAERGLQVLGHMRVVARDNNARIMEGVSPAEQELLNGLLSRMKGNLARLLEEARVASDEAMHNSETRTQEGGA